MDSAMVRTASDAQSNHSDSTTLSEFVKARWTGAVPVLGGNPVNGMRDFGRAASGSYANTRLLDAIGNLTNVLKDATLQNASYVYQSPSRRGSDSPIAMVANDERSFAMASSLDDAKITHLLSASQVKTDDIHAYMQLLKIARDGLKKKEASQELNAARKKAKISFSPLVSSGELEADLDENRGRLAKVKAICGFTLPPDGDVDLLRALTHDSYYQGRESNRVLAYIGDVACKLYASEQLCMRGCSAETVSDNVTKYQTNDAFRRNAIRLELDKFVRVAPNVDTSAKSVIATVYEAIVGAVYLHNGMDDVGLLNTSMQFYISVQE